MSFENGRIPQQLPTFIHFLSDKANLDLSFVFQTKFNENVAELRSLKNQIVNN
jgi:hypothetical protein